MAELAFPLASRLIGRVGSIASEEICLAWSVKADLQKLGRTMSTIRDVLLDAEEKQAHNKELRSWVRQLKDVFLDAEDLLDEFECEALQRQVVRGSDTTTKVRRFFSRSNPVAFRLRVGHEIKDIRERLHELKDDKNFADLRTVHHHPHLGEHVRENRNTTHSFVRASEVIGRETEKIKVVDLLMIQGDDRQGGDNGRNVSVIPLVGLGGLGKTTLAKLVYNDLRVVGSFDLRMWQHVSVDFDIHRLAKEILGSAVGTHISEGLSLDQLQEQLRDALKDKKFLLVLDDVWNEDRIKWSELRDLLVEGAKIGSKILVTTRNISVASIMGTVGTHINLEVLSFKDCFSLFVKCAFEEGQERQHPSLYEMGKDIVRKCGGVPLAVKTLGSQLYSKTDEHHWKLIRDSEIWELEREGAGHILPALRLSYNQLPFHLKQCLAYCSIFQKKYVQFDSTSLINHWMAHGILESSDHGKMELEDVGELYFRELWERSFFQNVKVYSFFYKFDMHDLIHDLVQSVTQGESFMVNSAWTKAVSENVRHLTILEIGQNVSTTLQKLNKVRTIAVDSCINIDESFLCTCISRFKYLRSLRLVNAFWKLLPSSIGSLRHLRSLDLTGNGRITELPNSICKLQSLQSLILGRCVNLEELPTDMGKLISLRYLELTTKQTSFPENGVGCLTSLRYLFLGECRNLTCLPRDTSYLASLHTLMIINCKQLDLVMENYQVIPLRLQKLGIIGVPRMVALPEWFQGATNTLQVLFIVDCENLEALPGWLTSFTSLRRVGLISCPKLLSFPEEMRRLTAVTKFEIVNCPGLERKCQSNTGEDWPTISHVPNVSFE
ncbi:disease resistance protein RGA2-like [Pyrus ussuriensis x Pyrus communis]|uniref:Disease resistance protein RGA2-like n=1 Tax=Pyrus ussuriensis x Pyrus communis TaxID=2448454 RepID=A0A5N5FYK4_9ROSA|nr:disease resistance protein RGA2-like [Pyrus ussuriensis x Pyrus communis]